MIHLYDFWDRKNYKKMSIGHSFGRLTVYDKITKKYEFRIENRFIHHKMMIAIIFIFDNLRTQGVL